MADQNRFMADWLTDAVQEAVAAPSTAEFDSNSFDISFDIQNNSHLVDGFQQQQQQQREEEEVPPIHSHTVEDRQPTLSSEAAIVLSHSPLPADSMSKEDSIVRVHLFYFSIMFK
jgi:hypothetical protein